MPWICMHDFDGLRNSLDYLYLILDFHFIDTRIDITLM